MAIPVVENKSSETKDDKSVVIKLQKNTEKTQKAEAPKTDTPQAEAPKVEAHDKPSAPAKPLQIVKKTPSRKRKFVKRAILVVLALLLVTIIVVAIKIVPPVLAIKSSIDEIQTEASGLKDDLSNKDFSKLPERIIAVQTDLKSVRNSISEFDWLEGVFFVSPYYKNVRVGEELLDQTDKLLTKITPKVENLVTLLEKAITERTASEKTEASATNSSTTAPKSAQVTNLNKCSSKLKDNSTLKNLGITVDSLIKTKSEESSSGNTKIRDIISVLPEAIDLYASIETDILAMIKTVNKLDVEALPGLTPQKYKDALTSLLAVTKDAENTFPQTSSSLKGLLTKVPDLLGSKKPVTYLVVFQNEKEMRASGGLLTAYGLLTVDKGKVVGDIDTHDMWDLQYDIWAYIGTLHHNIYGQKVLMERGCGASELRAQDSGIYSDLQVSTDMFLDYYDSLAKALPKKYKAYDNVILLNTFFASDMVGVVEPLVTEDCDVITAENLAKVIFANREDGERKSNIGNVAKAAEDEFSSISSDLLPEAAETLIKTVQAKNIAFSSKNKEMQKYFDDLGMTGRTVNDFKGDYFQLSEAQVCGLKANFYLYDTVTQNIKIADNGSVSNTVKIQWVNEKVYDRKEEDIISATMKFSYRAWLRIMTPQGTDYTFSDGLTKSSYAGYSPKEYYDEVTKKQVSDNIIWFNHVRMTSAEPAKKYDLNVKYTLPSSVKYTEADGYKLLLQKHPGKKDEKYTINVSYKGQAYKVEFALDRDKVVVFKNGQLNVENYPHPLDQYSDMVKVMSELKN